MPQAPQAVSARDAARIVGVNERTIRRWIRAGVLPAVRDGAAYRIDLDELHRTAAGQRTPDSAADTPHQTPQQPDIIEARYRVTPAEIEQAVERTGERYVADMASMFDRVDGLYRAQLDAKDETIGYLRSGLDQAGLRLAEQADAVAQLTAEREQARLHAITVEHEREQLEAAREHTRRQVEIVVLEREAVEAERDALRSRLSALETQQVESPAERTSTPETQPRRAWWRFWRDS